jgi:NADH:ubiquinone oxidoreductase subunit 4 (subunit M)
MHINYHIGVDGISMPLIILTTFSTVLVVEEARVPGENYRPWGSND